MSRAPKITENELFAAISEAHACAINRGVQRPPGAFTMDEYCFNLKIARSTAREHIALLLQNGTHERISAYYVNDMGRPIKTSMYRKKGDG